VRTDGRCQGAWRSLALAVLALEETVSFAFPAYHFVVLSHLHNVVPLLRGGRAWLLGLGLAGVLAVAFLIDYASGKSLYTAAASYHAYLEFRSCSRSSSRLEYAGDPC